MTVTQLLIEVPNFVYQYGCSSRGFWEGVFFGIEDLVADRLGHLEHVESSPGDQMALSHGRQLCQNCANICTGTPCKKGVLK